MSTNQNLVTPEIQKQKLPFLLRVNISAALSFLITWLRVARQLQNQLYLPTTL